jgi:SAM-dependent methyltransferase
MFKKKKNKAYADLAGAYDDFMKDLPYADWCAFITGRLKTYGIEDGLVCDLGCGSGTVTTMLSDAGYNMTGIDGSAEMLGQATEKKDKRDILYLEQDMRSFELYGTMRAFVSTGDALNYITEKKDLKHVFELVNNYLDPGGIFIFDMHTPAYYAKLGDGVYGDTTDDAGYIWQNNYNRSNGINEYDLTIFTRQEDSSYRRAEETHEQRAYSVGYIKKIATKCGFEILEVKADYTEKKARGRSDRVIYIIKKPAQT